jgi:hypothetical protein
MEEQVNKTIIPPDPIPYVNQVAREMYNIFADGMRYNPQGYTSIPQHTYDKLSTIFGAVSELERAAVFLQFKKELDDAGINYDVASFYMQEQQD